MADRSMLPTGNEAAAGSSSAALMTRPGAALLHTARKIKAGTIAHKATYQP
jgi:hypothetical protein